MASVLVPGNLIPIHGKALKVTRFWRISIVIPQIPLSMLPISLPVKVGVAPL